MGDAFSIFEEWYVLYKFAKDLHVILVQDTEQMKGDGVPAPVVSRHLGPDAGQGPGVLHLDGTRAIWSTKPFRQVLLGGIAWALRNVDADVPPNIAEVTPEALHAKH